jgi:hypothetical protein
MPGQPSASAGEDTKLWLLRAAKGLVVFVYAVVLIDLVLLTLGFFLRLFGASTEASFTRWVYRAVERIMEPFRGIFPARQLSDQAVLDTSLLFAMIVYAIAALAFHALIVWLTDKIVALRRRQRVAQRAGEALGELNPPHVGPPNAPARPAAGYPRSSAPPAGLGY